MSAALIFDLDGTLVDTAPDLLGAMNAVLVQEGRRPVDAADLRYLVGHGARAMLDEAFKRTGESADATRLPGLIDAFIAHYRAHIADASRPFPGVVETLTTLAAGGTKMAVLTNKPQELAGPLLDKLDLSKFFGAVHGAGRFNYVKPDARVFHHVVEELTGVPDAPAIMVGDSATDVATARAAKVPVILLSYGYTPQPTATLGGDAVTDDFREIPALARRLGSSQFMGYDAPMAQVLDSSEIVATIERLQARIFDRFPDSGLSKVCAGLSETAKATAARVNALARPYIGLRLLALGAVVLGLAAQIYAAEIIDWRRLIHHADATALTQSLDAAVNLLILAFGAIWFVLTLEQRLKRRRVLRQLYEFRALAHVIDMHQLTKDPTVLLADTAHATPSSPQRHMSEFELSRYLDYCSEMLALIAKLAALYAGQIQDETVIAAVNEVEDLTSNLGRKIWQKIMIISQLDEHRAREAQR
jgi:2-phosphoglycolate phosphatase